MAISDVKTAIQTSIQAALGIQCYTGIPSVITPPCAYIQTGEGNYLVNLGATKSERMFEVTIVFAKAEAFEDAQAKLDYYLLPTGTTSMKIAIQSASASATTTDFYRVISDTGVVSITHNDNSYIGAHWKVGTMI